MGQNVDSSRAAVEVTSVPTVDIKVDQDEDEEKNAQVDNDGHLSDSSEQQQTLFTDDAVVHLSPSPTGLDYLLKISVLNELLRFPFCCPVVSSH